MEQTILIAGGAGFIGSHITEKLLKESNKVICVDNLLTGSEKNIATFLNNPNFTFIKHDVIEPLKVDEHIDAIFHMASPASPNHHSKISYHALPVETMLVNTQGTRNLLELALSHKAKFLFASTSETYGDPLEHPQKESYLGNVSTTGPRSVYDEAKRFGETWVAYYAREKKVDARIARIFNAFGPLMLKDDMRMVPIFILQALQNKPITIFGNGKQTRSLCYITDTADGLCRLALTEGLRGEIVNIGSEEEHTVYEFAEMIKKLTNSKSTIEITEELPKDDPLRRRADIAKAKKLLGWQPHVSLEDGLKNMIDYFKSL